LEAFEVFLFLNTFAQNPADNRMSAPLKIFIIYAREDESFKISLLKAFKPLHRTGKIEIFHDGLIKPGERWEEAILENLRTAHIILPLVSDDFFDSEFIHEVEFKNAVARYNKRETTIIPVILKHCGWRYDPIIPTLQVLPKDGKPVVTWTYHEEAWEQILDAVHEVTEQAEAQKRQEKARKEAEAQRKKEEAEAKQKKEEAKRFFDLGLKATHHREKIELYSKAIEFDPNYADAFINRSNSKINLGQHAEALQDYDQVIRLKPDDADAFINRGDAKDRLGQYAEAIKDYGQAIRLKPDDAKAFIKRGDVKNKLGQYAEAIQDYDQAIRLKPDYPYAFSRRGRVKNSLGQYAEAIRDFDQAIRLKPDDADAFINRGWAKVSLNLLEEAIKDFDQAIRLVPSYDTAFSSRGRAKESLGQYAEAIKDYDQAIRLVTNSFDSAFDWGKEKLRLLEEAKKGCQKALSLSPNYKSAKTYWERLWK
jgi:tetratricopeptide (TPR) repeat protein